MRPRIVCAPDSFKGSLTATEAAAAMSRGIKRFDSELETVELPLSDGGEGLTEALIASTSGYRKEVMVSGPLGKKVRAFYGILGDGRGVMEMSSASGLTLLEPGELNPLETSTFGSGELLGRLLEEGCREIILGIGGSATNDGGLGMLQALGAKFFDNRGRELAPGGKSLNELAAFKLEGLDSRLDRIDLKIACDVDNPLTGKRGAAAVYGPQKGATPNMVRELDRGLTRLAAIIREKMGLEVDKVPGAGAAGGLGAGLMAFLGAELKPGSELVLDTVNFSEKIRDAELILTGEGRLDEQTARGKVVLGVVRRSRGLPVVALGGWVEPEISILKEEGLTAFFSILDRPRDLEDAMNHTYQLLEWSTREIVSLYFAGRKY